MMRSRFASSRRHRSMEVLMHDEVFALAAHGRPAGFTRRRLLGGFVGGTPAAVFGWQATEADRKRQSKRHDKHPKGQPTQGGDAQRGKDPSEAEGAGKQGSDSRALKVLTRNLYFGADLQPILQATSFPGLLTTVAQTFATVQATNFPERAKALADEIAGASPHVVGLQEVTIWRRGTPVDVARWTPGTLAETVEYDFLAILLDELAARGKAYAVVAQVQNVDAQAPGFAGAGLVRDVRLTDHDVLLARTDLPDKVFTVGGAESGNFAARVAGSLLGMPIAIPSGWTRADVSLWGRTVRIVETHLEPFDLGIQELQRAELVNGPLATAAPTVLIGDLNSPADRGSTYQKLVAAGFADA
jgi:hypothetical protein